MDGNGSDNSGADNKGGDNQQQQQQQQQQVATRPDYVPEKFWDAQKGEPRLQDAFKSYGELSTKLSQGKAAYDAERLKARPAKPDGYTFKMPDQGPIAEMATKAGVVLLTEKPGADFKAEAGKSYFLVNPADPLMGFWRDHAYAHGLSNDEFLGGLVQFAARNGERMPTEDESKASLKAEYAKLGEHGAARADHVWNRVQALLGDKAKALDEVVGSASAIEALETLLEKVGEPKFSPPGGDTVAAGTTKEALDAIMAEPDYWQNADKQKRVREGYAKLFPGRTKSSTDTRMRVA